MALKDAFKVNRKTFFNPTGWFGYNEVKSNILATWTAVSGLFKPAKPTREESFEEAKARLGLSEQDIKGTQDQYFLYSMIFLALGIFTLAASFYFLLHHGTLSGWILGLATTSLFSVQAFRFHFWYFQMKHRKLGCTFEEWWRGKVNHEENTP